MRRRALLSAGAAVLGSMATGCLEGGDDTPASAAEPRGLHLEPRADGPVVELETRLPESVEVTVQATGRTGVRTERTVTVDPDGARRIPDLFASGNEPFTVQVSAAGDTVEREISPRGTPKGRFTFTITPEGISYEATHRSEADLSIVNRREARVEVTVTVDDRSTTAGPRSRTVSVPATDSVGYDGVFTDGTEYRVTVATDGLRESTTHVASFTSGVSVAIGEDSLRVDTYDK